MSRVTDWLERRFRSLAEAEPPHRTSFQVGDRFIQTSTMEMYVLTRFQIKALPNLGLARHAVLTSETGTSSHTVPEVYLGDEEFKYVP